MTEFEYNHDQDGTYFGTKPQEVVPTLETPKETMSDAIAKFATAVALPEGDKITSPSLESSERHLQFAIPKTDRIRGLEEVDRIRKENPNIFRK